MESISRGCRLCLDPFAERFTTIESPELQDKVEKVFWFAVESRQGCCSGVCQSCSYTISEFYQYSEKVRQNQELLNGNAINNELNVDCKLSLNELNSNFECFKTEMVSDSEVQESVVDVVESKAEIFKEIDKCAIANDWKESSSKMELLRVPKNETSDSETDEQKPSKRRLTKTQEDIDKEDQVSNEQFHMNCDLCDSSVSTFKELRRHFWDEHKRGSVYIMCCNKKFDRKCTILDHIHYHINPDAFRCEVCSKDYKNNERLSIHMLNSHSSEDRRPFKCDRCSQSFEQKSALDRHMERHQKVKCPQCNKFFSSKDSLNTHKTNHHGKDRTKVCDTCGRKFKTQKGLQQHMNEHMGIEVPRFQCDICQRWLKGEGNYKTHVKFVHGSNDQVQCDICQKEYPHLLSLQKHKTMTHAEAKYECEFCGKKFKQSLAWKEHRTIHTGEMLYACEFCGEPFKGKSNLYSHVKKKHPTDWAEKKLKTAQKSGLV